MFKGRSYFWKFWGFFEFFMHTQMASETCKVLKTKQIQNLIQNNEKYDVILVEQFNTDCMMAVAWKLQAPTIGLCSGSLMAWHYDRVGLPHMASYVSEMFSGYTEKMSYIQRLGNWLTIHSMKFLYR